MWLLCWLWPVFYLLVFIRDSHKRRECPVGEGGTMEACSNPLQLRGVDTEWKGFMFLWPHCCVRWEVLCVTPCSILNASDLLLVWVCFEWPPPVPHFLHTLSENVFFICMVTVRLSLPSVNSGNLTDLAAFHLSLCNYSHFSKPQKLPAACWQVDRLSGEPKRGGNVLVHEIMFCVALIRLVLSFSLFVLFATGLLPRWGLFSTWKSHIPEGLCGPAALCVTNRHTHMHKKTYKPPPTRPPIKYTLTPCSPKGFYCDYYLIFWL